MSVTVGDCRETMRRWIADGVRVQMCVTSPPYWGLRDYGCAGQLGLEPTITEYVANMVEVFGLVRELLADDGVLWLNLGDSYCSSPRGSAPGDLSTSGLRNPERQDRIAHPRGANSQRKGRSNCDEQLSPNRSMQDGLKPKDLCGIPWRVAFALQAAGWWLRQDVIWSKPNPMPESVTDRCTKAHEYLFLLSKSARYYFDAAAIADAASSAWDPDDAKACDGWDTGDGGHGTIHRAGREKGKSGNKARKPSGLRGVPAASTTDPNGGVAGSVPWQGSTRNRRSVWTIATQPYAEAHFATFPRALVEPCIMAGSRVGDVVLDPFMGSGTVGQVAQDLGRRWLGCELNSAYVALSAKRTAQGAMVLA